MLVCEALVIGLGVKACANRTPALASLSRAGVLIGPSPQQCTRSGRSESMVMRKTFGREIVSATAARATPPVATQQKKRPKTILIINRKASSLRRVRPSCRGANFFRFRARDRGSCDRMLKEVVRVWNKVPAYTHENEYPSAKVQK